MQYSEKENKEKLQTSSSQIQIEDDEWNDLLFVETIFNPN